MYLKPVHKREQEMVRKEIKSIFREAHQKYGNVARKLRKVGCEFSIRKEKNRNDKKRKGEKAISVQSNLLSRSKIDHAFTDIAAMVCNSLKVANQEKQICSPGDNTRIFCHHFYQFDPD